MLLNAGCPRQRVAGDRYRRSVPDPAPVPPALRDAILDWYARTGRELAFRTTRDPWAILVSETMAQQTQAARAAEAWLAFMDRFPTVDAVATAPAGDVLRAWAGLGYNRRAVHLHRAARVIVGEHRGRVPDTVEALVMLPGVGPYTARAVAAIAFGRPVGAVDTNVRRVLGRVSVGDPASLGSAALQAMADAAVPVDDPGTWTHAVMDLGARLCRPRRPRCTECPALAWCRFAQVGPADARGPAAAAAPNPPIAAPRFEATSRWLRGRILARLREAPDDRWVTLGGPIGNHPPDAVSAALRSLEAEGLLELSGEGRHEARLPLG
jgi:A/G-specific adenine glycosylase